MKTYWPITLALLVLSGAAVACAAPNAPEATLAPAATEAPETSPTPEPPQSTPAPTLPVPTATLPPTATVASPAPTTPDPNRNLGAVVYSDSFDGRSGWFWTYTDDVASFAAKDGELKIATKQGNNTWRYVARDDIKAGDQQLRLVARTTVCPGNDEYGVMYRAAYNPDQTLHAYVFKLNCGGQARVEVMNASTITVLKDWETYVAVKAGAPAENTITIWMAKDQFHFYANDHYLFSLTDATLAEGFYGFIAASHGGGGGAMSFDDFTVTGVDAP